MTLLQMVVAKIMEPNPTVEIAGVSVDPDPDLAARNAEKVEQAKRALGEKYILHPSHRVTKAA